MKQCEENPSFSKITGGFVQTKASGMQSSNKLSIMARARLFLNAGIMPVILLRMIIRRGVQDMFVCIFYSQYRLRDLQIGCACAKEWTLYQWFAWGKQLSIANKLRIYRYLRVCIGFVSNGLKGSLLSCHLIEINNRQKNRKRRNVEMKDSW